MIVKERRARRFSETTLLILSLSCYSIRNPNNGCSSFGVVEGFAVKKTKNARNTNSGGGAGFGKTVAAPTTYSPDSSPEMANLMKFLTNQKAQVQHVEVGKGKEGPNTSERGLYTTKAWKSGQIICKIPSDCGLALADPTSNLAKSPTLTIQALELLNNYLDTNKNDDVWKAYLDTLPNSITTPTPNCWESDEVDLLELPRMMQYTRDRQAEMQQVLKNVKESGEKIDLQRLEYATWIVSSRSIPLSVAPDGATSAEPEYDARGQVILDASSNKNPTYIRVLVPLLDMVNHANLASSSSSDSKNVANVRLTILDAQKDLAWFALEATRNIPVGRELCMAYGTGGGGEGSGSPTAGTVDSMDLLLNYGIVAPHNPLDEYVLEKGSGDDDMFASNSDWTTTLAEDESLLELLEAEDDSTEPLRTILQFRRQLKESYKQQQE